MFVKVFVLGRPGSGKTTAIHHLLESARQHKILALNVDDYSILYHMSRQDIYHKQFRDTDYNGFDVLDPSVFDTALEILEQEIRTTASSAQNGIITIEFARHDYRYALSKFQPDFLEDAYVFFVDADLHTCIQRIYQRVASPLAVDNHFVSDQVMHAYYSNDNWLYVNTQLKKEYNIHKEVKAFRNTGSITTLYTTIDEFIEDIIQTEFHNNSLSQPEITETDRAMSPQLITC
jgi:adenylate kinase family enzyme